MPGVVCACVGSTAVYFSAMRMEVNQFNDGTWIHSTLRHFIVIANELTRRDRCSAVIADAPEVVLWDHLVGESRCRDYNDADLVVVGGASVAN